jgi:hypothetical protein
VGQQPTEQMYAASVSVNIPSLRESQLMQNQHGREENRDSRFNNCGVLSWVPCLLKLYYKLQMWFYRVAVSLKYSTQIHMSHTTNSVAFTPQANYTD